MNSDLSAEISKWSTQTFAEQLDEIKEYYTPTVVELTSKCFEELSLTAKFVNGYACENLPKSEEGNTSVRINYTDVFHDLIQKKCFTPTRYLTELVRIFHDRKVDSKKLVGFIARGLRTLTSLLREPEFKDKLILELMKSDNNARATLCPKGDAKDHTDILVDFKNKEFRIWLYQLSDRGLPHDIERVSGMRGKLPGGIHVLCPLRTRLALPYVKNLRAKEKNDGKISLWEGRIKNSEKEKEKKVCFEKLEQFKNKKIEIHKNLQTSKTDMENEIDVIEGWFLYSQRYVENIADKIIKFTKADDYHRVLEIMQGPRLYLSDVRLFVVK